MQGERTGAGARQEGVEAKGGTDRLIGQPGQLVVPAESRADVSAHGFWKRGTTAMFDIIIFNLNAGSYLRMTPEKALAKAEKENKDLCLQAFLECRRNFTHMVYSADGIPGAEALAVQKRLAALLRYKLKQEYSEMCGFVRERMSLAIVRSNSLLLRGPRNKGTRIWQRPELTDGVVMSLPAPCRG